MPNKVVIHTEQELEKVAKEAFYLLRKLRESTVRWENEHGVATKTVKKNWEQRADTFLRNPMETNNLLSDGLEIEKE